MNIKDVLAIAQRQASKKGVSQACSDYAYKQTYKYLKARYEGISLQQDDISQIFAYFWAIIKRKSAHAGSAYSSRLVLKAFVNSLISTGRDIEEVISEMYESYAASIKPEILKEMAASLRA